MRRKPCRHQIRRHLVGRFGRERIHDRDHAPVGSSALGPFFENILYVAAVAPIAEDLVAGASDPAAGQALWWGFPLGADFGGNGTAVAASANVVASASPPAPATRSASGRSLSTELSSPT
jgi:hypothetical protein